MNPQDTNPSNEPRSGYPQGNPQVIDDNAVVQNYATDITQVSRLESLEEPLEVHALSAPQPSVNAMPKRFMSGAFFSRRRAMIISTLITLAVLMLTIGAMAFLVRRAPEDKKQNAQVTEQRDVKIEGALDSTIPKELQGAQQSLLVNGDVVTRGSLRISSGGFATVIRVQNPTDNQILTLPSGSGTICLDNNSCGYAALDDLTTLQGNIEDINSLLNELKAKTPPAGVDTLNGQRGTVSIQGSLNQISVSTSNGVVKLSTPQDLDSNANVQFGSLTLGATGQIVANTLIQTGAGNSVNINAGNDMITFTAGGRVFQLPSSGGASQTICTTGASCASGGGTAVLLADGTAQTDSNSNASIYINDTGGGNLIQVQTSGVDRFVVANNGNTGVSGSLTVSSLGTGVLRSTGGLLGVGTVSLTSEVSGVLPVSNGGTGLNTIPANGILIGNGTSPVSSATAAGVGLCLISTAGAPSFQACPGGGSFNSFTLVASSGTTETVNDGETVTIAGSGNVTTTASASNTVTINTVANPTFSTSVTTPLLQSSGALSITPGGAFTAGATTQATVLQGSSTTITSSGATNDIVLTSADQIRLTGFNCAALGNGGKLTTDASGNISCAADNGGSDSAITGTGNANRVALFTGAQTVADSWLLQNGSTLELDNTRNLSLLGGNFSVVGTGLFSGLITANGDLTIEAGDTFTFNGEAFTDLTGTGLSFNSGSLQTTLGTSVDLTSEVNGVLPVASGGTGVNGSSAANGQLLVGNGTGFTLATVTQGTGITITNGAGSITVASTLGVAIDSSEITDLTITNVDIANSTINLSTKTTGNYVATVADSGSGVISVSGSGSNNAAVTLGLIADSIGDTQLAFNTGQHLTTASSPSFAGATVTGGTFTVGTTSQLASLVLHDGNGQTTTLRPGDSAGNLTFILPVADGSANQCIKTNASGVLSFGNCVASIGGGGGVTGSGTQNRLSKFDASGTNLVDSTISDNGTTVSTTVNVAVQGGGLTLGTALQNAALTLYGNGFTANIDTSSINANNTYSLPAGIGGDFCIRQLGNCSGSGGGNAPASSQYLTLALDAGLSAERTLSFNGTNFSVVDNGANNNYTVNTAQNINTGAAPSFAGLTLTGNLQLNANTIQGGAAVIDFTNFDVGSGGSVTAGTYNGQTISSTASLTGTLSVAGLTTLNGGLTVDPGDTLTFNGDAFTDLTGNGLQVTTNTLTILTQTSKGLEVDGNGLSLIDCASGEILKYNGSNQWACATDAGGSGVGDNVQVNGTNANDANFVNTAASGGTVAATTFALNVGSPDQITLTVGVANATDAGVITAGTQTFGGAKTFNGLITAAAGVTVSASQSLTVNGDAVQDLTGNGLQVTGNSLALLLDSGSGLSASGSGLSLLRTCGNGEILKWNGSAWACAPDGGSGGAVTSVNALDGALTLQGTAGQIDITDDGVDEITLSLDAAVTLQGNTFNGAGQLVQLTGGGLLPSLDGSNLTSLNASALTSGTVASGVVSGSYTGITGVGTLSVGVWNGTAITDTYVTDDLTISATGTVNWLALNNYPAACNAGEAIVQLGDSVTCAVFAAGSGSGNYIQNQNASQQTANYWVSGTSRSDTSVLTPTIDATGATALNIGTTNATSINLNKNVVIAANQSLTLTGGNTASRPGSPTEGMAYFDSDTDRLLVYSNGKWQADRSDAILVAASNSSQADKDAADYVADGNTGTAADGDQVQINAALSAASGKKVVLLGGTYVADATILIPNNTALIGVGKGTLIELADLDATDNLIENSDTSLGTGITIRDLRISGRKDLNTAGTQRGIVLDTMGGGTGSSARQGAQIIAVEISNFRSENIYLTASNNNFITNITSQASSADGVQLTGSSNNNVITGSKFQGNTSNGLLINGSSGSNTVTGNHSQGNTSSGFSFSSSTNNEVSSNISNGNGYGFFISTNSTNNTFTGNTAQGNSSSTFYINATGNTLTGNTANGGTYGFNLNSDNNTVTGNTAQSNTYGIYVNSNYSTVSGNTVNTSATNGIAINNGDNNLISGNKIYNSGGNTANNGISIFTSDSNQVTNNSVSDTSATTTNYAINISNNTSDTNYISGNTLGTGSINDLGTGTVYGGQTNSSGNFVIQPAGTVELMKNTNVTGTLNITSDVDTNGSLTVGNANQFVISNAGVVTSGTWNGTALTDTYIADNITVDWTGLQNYPAGCAAGSAITTIADVPTCTAFAAGSGSGSYIQNQFAGAQTGASFWIQNDGRVDGNLTVATTLYANNIDAISGGQLLIGDASSDILLGNGGVNTTVQGSLIVTGSGSPITILGGGGTGSRPGSPTEGMIYYDTDIAKLLIYSNGKWQADRTSVTKTVAPSNASQEIKDSADYVASGTSDQSTINTALTAAAGGKVYLFEGTFTVNGSISIPNNTTLAGAGRGTLITIPNSLGSNLYVITNTDTTTGAGVTIQDLRLDGNSTNQSGTADQTGIFMNNMGGGSGASARSGATIRNIESANWYSDSSGAGSQIGIGISLSSSNNSKISGNTVRGGKRGIYTHAGNHNVISGNTVQGNDYGIFLNGNSGSGGSSNSNISNNIIEGNQHGVYITGGGTGISKGNNVVGNSLDSNTSSGIYLQVNSAETTVRDNTIVDSGDTINNNGIHLTQSDDNYIIGNTITDTSCTSSCVAISIDSSASDNTYLANNTLGGGSIADNGTGTIYGGQLNVSGNYVIQPAGTVELMKNTNVTGTLNITSNVDTNGSLTVGNANQFVISNTGVATSGTWQAGTIGLLYGGTNNTSYTTNGIVYSSGTSLVSTAAGTTGQCLLATTGSAPTWGACTATDLQGTYAASSAPATINLTNSKDIVINATEQTVDSSVVINLQCATCSANGGRFAVQDAGTDVFTVNPDGSIVIGNGGNTVTFSGTDFRSTAAGNARQQKKLILTPEYAGAVLNSSSDASCSSANNGTMTAGFNSTDRISFYEWVSGAAATNCYDVIVQVPLPSDWAAWNGAPTLQVQNTSGTNSTSVMAQIIRSDGTTDTNYSSYQGISSGTSWGTTTMTGLNSSGYAADGYMTVKIRLTSTGTSQYTRIGNLTLNYYSKF